MGSGKTGGCCVLARELLEAHAHMTVLPGFSPRSTGDTSGPKVRQRTLTLPQGTVMAYKRKQLVFQETVRGEQSLKGVGGVGDHPEATLASLPAGGGEEHDFSASHSHLQACRTEPWPHGDRRSVPRGDRHKGGPTCGVLSTRQRAALILTMSTHSRPCRSRQLAWGSHRAP